MKQALPHISSKLQAPAPNNRTRYYFSLTGTSTNTIIYQSLLIHLLLNLLLHILLSSLQPTPHISQRLLRKHKTSRNNRLPRGNKSIPPALLILRPINPKDVVLHIARKAHRVPGGVVDRPADLLGVLADDGEAGVDLAQACVAEGVGAGEVGGHVGVGGGEVGEEGLCEAVVAFVGVVEGFGTVGVCFEEGDGVGDERVGGEVLFVSG